jgi:hypothetical protein
MIRLDDEILANAALELQDRINAALRASDVYGKQVELNLKLKIKIEERSSYKDGIKTDSWKEPFIEYEIKTKLKESTETRKGFCEPDFKLVTDVDGNTEVVKVGQMDIDDYAEGETLRRLK